MAKSKARFLADVLQDDGSSIFVGNFAVPADFVIDPAGSPTGLGNASLENSSITINSYDTALGSFVTLVTDDINEGGSPTNLYFTNARAQAAFTGGTGVTITSGEVAIGQSVGTTDNVTFNQVTATVPYDNSVSGLTATNVQSAITELNTLLGGGNVGSQATYNVYEYTTSGNDTQFDLSALSPAGSYIPGYVQVYLNGLLLSESDYTAVDGSTINFSPAITNAGQLLYIVAYDSFNTAEILRVTSIDASASTNSISLDANDDLSLTGSLSFADNEKAIFGADSDLQIYHDGSKSIVLDNGTGDLFLSGNNLRLTNATIDATYLQAINGGAVDIRHNGSVKLATTSTGIDVTGTVTADGLTVENVSGATLNVNTNLGAADAKILLHEGTTGSPVNGASIRYDGTNNLFKIGVGTSVDTTRLSIDRNTGDISFYEDTGASAKFFWDASAESLGIGTTSPVAPLTVSGNNFISWVDSAQGGVRTNEAAGTTASVTGYALQYKQNVGLGYHSWETSANTTAGNALTYEEHMRISSTGSVSIYGRTDISYDSPVFVLNDTDATSPTEQIGYISFQRQGVERSWIGYGTSTDDNFIIRNTEGPVTVNAAFEVTGTSTLPGQVTFGDTSTTAADLRLYDTGNNQLQLSGIGSNDFLVDLLGTSGIGTLKFNDFYVSIDVNSGTDALTLISSSTGTAGPQLDFTFEKATPADNDVVGRINFNGRNSSAEGITYARIDGVSSQTVDGAETGELSFSTRRNTTQFEEVLRIDNTGQMIIPDIEIYTANDGLTDIIGIGTKQMQPQYPYRRIDSFSTDGSGYFWAFGAHDNAPNSTSIKMLINDSQTVDEVTVIGALKVRDFASNEYNSSYPTFSTTGVTLNSDGSLVQLGDSAARILGGVAEYSGGLANIADTASRTITLSDLGNFQGVMLEVWVTYRAVGGSTAASARKLVQFFEQNNSATDIVEMEFSGRSIVTGDIVVTDATDGITITITNTNWFGSNLEGTSGAYYLKVLGGVGTGSTITKT